MTRTTACAGAAAMLWSCEALGQPGCEPGWGEPFSNVPAINTELCALVVFDDGSGPTLYAGAFTNYNGQSTPGLLRWQGGHWEEAADFEGPWINGGPPAVYSLTVLDIGGGPELFAAGQFATVDGMPASMIARWNGKNWSAMGAGFDWQVRALAIFDDGTGPALYAAGRFTKSGTTTCRGLARWTGSEWVEVGGGLGSIVYGAHGLALGVYDLGQGPRLYVGGRFQLASTTPGQYWNCIAAWDGTAWSGLASGVTTSSQIGVRTMTVFDYGSGPQLTIAGGFSIPGGSSGGPKVARWTGSQWVQIGSIPGDSSQYVNAMAIYPGPKGSALHVGGLFHYTYGTSVVRLDNGVWNKLGPVNSTTRALITTEEGGNLFLYAAGLFTLAGNSTANRVARWDGEQWAGLEHGGRGLYGAGYAACVFNDGSGERVFVGGEFAAAGDRVHNSIAAWDGREWHQVGGGMGYTGSTVSPAEVNALALFDDGAGHALYATGLFDRVDGVPCNSFARWDGTNWTTPGGSGLWYQGSAGGGWMTGTGEALTVHDDGSGPALYVGGRIGRADDVLVDKVARWNGVAWSSPGGAAGTPGFEIVGALAAFDEGAGHHLFAGGNFKTIGGVQAYGVARWDGAAWSPVGSGFPPIGAVFADVADLAVIHSGTGTALVAGGRYGTISSPQPTQLLLARWDGQSWSPLTGGSGIVSSGGLVHHVWSFDDGDGPALYVGGALNPVGTVSAFGLFRRRADAWDMPGGGVTVAYPYQLMGVYATAIRREGDHDVLLMTGWFSHAGGEQSVGVAEWRACRACYGDCNRDSALTPADFGCFQTRFVAADPWADCNADGALTVQDFGCFQTKFVMGCP